MENGLLNGEHLLSLSHAAAHRLVTRRRNGKSVSLMTISRWVRIGCFGVRLETTTVGGTKIVRTSVEALRRFLHRVDQMSPDRRFSLFRHRGKATKAAG
jgi:hypothetical protein